MNLEIVNVKNYYNQEFISYSVKTMKVKIAYTLEKQKTLKTDLQFIYNLTIEVKETTIGILQ